MCVSCGIKGHMHNYLLCVCMYACPFDYFKITGNWDVFLNTVGRLVICVSLFVCQSVRRGLQSALSCTNFENSLNDIFSFCKIYTANHTDCVFPIAVAIFKQWKHNFARLQKAVYGNLKIKLLVYLMANKHNQSIYHDVFTALVSATYNHKTFKTSEFGRFLQKVRFCFLKRKKMSHMMFNECLSVACSNKEIWTLMMQ